MEGVITDLDLKLNNVLKRQEYDYLKGYNIYVKRKEKDLRELFDKLQEKSNNTTIKDEKIIKLEKTIIAINSQRVELEQEKQKLTENVKSLKAQAVINQQERDFLNN